MGPRHHEPFVPDNASDVYEKIEKAQRHSREAERLVSEVEEDLKDRVIDETSIDGEITVSYVPDEDLFRVSVLDKQLVEALQASTRDEVTVFGNAMSIEIATEEDLLPSLGGQPRSMKEVINAVEAESDRDGAPYEQVVTRAGELGFSTDEAEDKIEELRKRGEVYMPIQGLLRAI